MGAFCPRCGQPVASAAAVASGAPARVFCPECGYESPPGVRFCMRCGAPMSGSGVAAPVGAQVLPPGRRSRRGGVAWWAWVLLLLALIALGAVLWLRFGQD
ncbi:MAG: zinc ribbon domain-containing protein, partial [Chloroflexi bacterium]|nr:zinc ribbon domain-containing protein [Chloroflexota bacterium]